MSFGETVLELAVGVAHRWLNQVTPRGFVGAYALL